MFNGRIFYTSNLQMISSGYYQGYKLIYIGDSLEMPQDFNFIDGALFTPDYRTISAALEGNDSLLVNNYNNQLNSSNTQEFIAVILSALMKGINVLIYFPEEVFQLKFPYILLEYFRDIYGILIGNEYQDCIFNINSVTNSNIYSTLYMSNIIDWKSFISNVEKEYITNYLALCKIRGETSKLYNIPPSVSDIEFLDYLYKHNNKNKLFSNV